MPNCATRNVSGEPDENSDRSFSGRKQRRVMFDVGHGGGSFDFSVAEVAIPGGCTPDTISSDIHVFSGNTPGMPYLPNVMSKFPLDLSLEQVAAATVTPAKIINRAPKIGTLQIGAPGDGADHDQRRAVRPALPGAVRRALGGGKATGVDLIPINAAAFSLRDHAGERIERGAR